MSEKHIEIVATLYKARKAVRSLYPDSYADHCMDWQDTIKKVAAGLQISELEAVIDILAKLADESGSAFTQMWVMAAYVEMVEPSA